MTSCDIGASGNDTVETIKIKCGPTGSEKSIDRNSYDGRNIIHLALKSIKPLREASLRGQKKIILLIHGIRTRANWQGMVSSLIEKHTEFVPIPIKYGYYDVFRFWLPFKFIRRQPIERVHKELREVQRKNPGADIQVLAHSYGTHTICSILEQYDDIKLSRLILCGSVVRSDFNWSRISDQVRSTDGAPDIINECGTKDIWPILARSTTWGYGSTGTFGFGTNSVKDRFHSLPHSGYFDERFVNEYWIPLIGSGTFASTATDETGASSPWWIAPLSLPFRWGLLPFVAAVVWGGVSTTSVGKLVNLFAKQTACTVSAVSALAACSDVDVGNVFIEDGGSQKYNDTLADVNAKNGIAAGRDIKAGDIIIGIDKK